MPRRKSILYCVLLPACLLLAGCQASPADEPIKSGATPEPAVEPVESTDESAVEPTDKATPVLGQERIDSHGIAQVWVPAGSFLMGSDVNSIKKLSEQDPPPFVAGEFPSEQPQHPVTISKGYWIDKFEVTNKAFRAFVDDGGYDRQELWSPEGWEWRGRQSESMLPFLCPDDDNPVAFVTWYEAEAYANWRGGRLPTEAEWEYAARGPESSIYPWGDEFDENKCNVVRSNQTKPVGSYPEGVSWVGAHDMAGNVMEWVQDWLADYTDSAVTDPHGPETGEVKVEKGGWWGSNPFVARSAYRHFEDPPQYYDGHIGFRIVSPY